MIYLTTRKTFNIVSMLVRWFMGTEYSHCGLVFKRGKLDLVAESTSIYGVRIVTLESFLKTNKIIEKIKIPNHYNAKNAVEYCYENLGDAYSTMSLFGLLLNRFKWGSDNDNKFICSELMARALNIKHQSLDHITVKQLKDLLEGEK